jgi:hypothetical protein
MKEKYTTSMKENLITKPINWVCTGIVNSIIKTITVEVELIAQRDNLLSEQEKMIQELARFKMNMRKKIEKIFLSEFWESELKSLIIECGISKFSKGGIDILSYVRTSDAEDRVEANKQKHKQDNSLAYQYSEGLVTTLLLTPEKEKWSEDIQFYWNTFEAALSDLVDSLSAALEVVEKKDDTISTLRSAYKDNQTHFSDQLRYLQQVWHRNDLDREILKSIKDEKGIIKYGKFNVSDMIFFELLETQLKQDHKYFITTVYRYHQLQKKIDEKQKEIGEKRNEILFAGVGKILKPVLISLVLLSIYNFINPVGARHEWYQKAWRITNYVGLKGELPFTQYNSELIKALNFKRKTLSKSIQAQSNFNFESNRILQHIADSKSESEVASNILFGDSNQSTLKKDDIKYLAEHNFIINKKNPAGKDIKAKEEKHAGRLKDILDLNSINQLLYEKIATSMSLTFTTSQVLQNTYASIDITTSFLDPVQLGMVDSSNTKNNSEQLSDNRQRLLSKLNLLEQGKSTNQPKKQTSEIKFINENDNSTSKEITYDPGYVDSFDYTSHHITTIALDKSKSIKQSINSWQAFLDSTGIVVNFDNTNEVPVENSFRMMDKVNFYRFTQTIYNRESDIAIDTREGGYTNSNEFFLKMLNKSGLKAEEIYDLVNNYSLSSHFAITSYSRTPKNLKQITTFNKEENSRKFGQLSDSDPIDMQLYDLINEININKMLKTKVKILKVSTDQLIDRQESIYYILIEKEKAN